MSEQKKTYIYKAYKNVNKTALMFYLPSGVFYPVAGLCVVLLILAIIVRTFVFALVVAILVGGIYGAAMWLSNKYGEKFKDRLIAYYTDQNFKVIRKITAVKHYLKREG